MNRLSQMCEAPPMTRASTSVVSRPAHADGAHAVGLSGRRAEPTTESGKASSVSYCRTGASRNSVTAAVIGILLSFGLLCPSYAGETKHLVAPQWQQIELSFTASRNTVNPYTDVEAWVDFVADDGAAIRRPMFWDGDQTFRVRFTSDRSFGTWHWKASDRDGDPGLNGLAGVIEAVAAPVDSETAFSRHGLLKMSPGKRNVVFQDGTSFFMVADTPWALPWRATVEAVTEYAADRQSKGFNAALLMSVQPDQDARGPRSRTEVGGFDVGFEDLPEGHLNELRPEYFQYLDRLIEILYIRGIAPVLQPVFQGYGWKGLRTLGGKAVPEEYARYCRYLVARYGARPAMWLVSADGQGAYRSTIACGEEIERWDAYQQPTGFHYSPSEWPHSRQSADWLDFQWTQTGHNGEHLQGKVRPMAEVLPVKAVANGEPTYEGIRDAGNGAGWWQGEEAWLNLTSGGTMGVVYGAGGLWQWKIERDEKGWPDWADSPGVSWREATALPGSRFAGLIGKALAGYDITDMTRLPEIGPQAVGKLGSLYIVYLPRGGDVAIGGLNTELPYLWFDPRSGDFADNGRVSASSPILTSPTSEPWVLLVGKPNTCRGSSTAAVSC